MKGGSHAMNEVQTKSQRRRLPPVRRRGGGGGEGHLHGEARRLDLRPIHMRDQKTASTSQDAFICISHRRGKRQLSKVKSIIIFQ